MTYAQVYHEGAKRLKDAGIDENELDARLLLEKACNTDANTLYAHPEREVTPEEFESFELDLLKRENHIPLQHILGYTEFMGLDFLVNGDVLIPRQDTEFLVEEALTYIEDGMSVLDMCTGSGCILLSIMKYKNDIKGYGCDASKRALCVAQKNAEKHNLNACFLEGDLFEAVAKKGSDNLDADRMKFDVILSNPPYIPSHVIDTLSKEVKDHDPHMALDGGIDGLDFYRRLAKDAKSYLVNYGRLYLEIGHDQGESVPKILEEEGYKDIVALKDYSSNWRVVRATYIV